MTAGATTSKMIWSRDMTWSPAHEAKRPTSPPKTAATFENALVTTTMSTSLAFSAGIHYCVGAALAKMEGEVALRALFDRFPDLALTMPPHRRPSPVLRGYDTMPATLSPAGVPA
jgi:cytochrome P450